MTDGDRSPPSEHEPSQEWLEQAAIQETVMVARGDKMYRVTVEDATLEADD